MRQLVQLHDQLEAFSLLDTDVIAVALEEDDPKRLARVNELVGEGITVVAGVDGAAASLGATSAILVDKKGVIRSVMPGIVQARAPSRLIIQELAEMTGRKAPSLEELNPPLGSGGPLSARWAWSHDSVGPGDPLKLIFLPEIVQPAMLGAWGERKLKIELTLPEGLELVKDFELPAGKPAPERLGIARVYQGDVPLTALELRGTDALEDGEAELQIQLTYSLCAVRGCHDPESKTWKIPIRTTEGTGRRGQLFNWETW